MALTKYNFNSFDVTSAASKALGFNANANGFATISPGSMTLIKTLTASSSSTISFVNGSSDVVLDSTYPVYLFKFINIHPSDDASALQVNFRDGGSSYDASKNTTYFLSRHAEDDSGYELSYKTNLDLANGTGVQKLTVDADNDNDSGQSGYLYLFNPSSTTFVKHFFSRVQTVQTNAQSMENYVAGYCNVTAAIDAVQFSSSANTLDSGTIKLYGIKDS